MTRRANRLISRKPIDRTHVNRESKEVGKSSPPKERLESYRKSTLDDEIQAEIGNIG